MIEVKNLVKRYGDHIAVDHLSFTVEKGQILGFLGPNGAGKTTTMNIITGYISATEGTVTVNGKDVFEEPEEVKKMIGYLPEFPPLYPDMTVREYLNFVADIKKVGKDEKKQMVEDIMNATRITSMSDRLIEHLSKGYKQRVGLAQAIMGYPELIILDEPTVGLDPKQIIEIRDLIKDLSKKHTVILSSHIMQEVSAVCDTILIIDRGKLIICDKPENLSARLGATGGVRLSVKGNKTAIINALKKVRRIKKIKENPPVEEGVVELTVHCGEKEDIREEVFHALVDAKTTILEMQSLRMSLEEIFLKVTNREKPTPIELDAPSDLDGVAPSDLDGDIPPEFDGSDESEIAINQEVKQKDEPDKHAAVPDKQETAPEGSAGKQETVSEDDAGKDAQDKQDSPADKSEKEVSSDAGNL